VLGLNGLVIPAPELSAQCCKAVWTLDTRNLGLDALDMLKVGRERELDRS
jgi:hypothetical protein